MEKDEILELLDSVEEDMKEKFPKPYSAGRREQLSAHVATCKMIVEAAHDESEREEDDARKDQVLQQMVLGGRQMSEAKDAVERGER